MSIDVNKILSSLKEAREKKEISFESLSEKTGISAATLYRYESGVTSIPLDKLPLIAEALDLDLKSHITEWDAAHELGHLPLSPRYRWVARNARKMTDEELSRLQTLMQAAFNQIDFEEDDDDEEE